MASAVRTPLALSGGPLALLVTAAHLATDAFANVLPVYLPTLQLRFGVGEAVLAAFVAVVSLSANVLQAFVGGLVERWGRRRTTALGLILTSSLMSLIAVAPTVPSLVLLLAVGGLGSAVFHPGAVSTMRSAGRRAGLFVGMFTAGGAVGSALMPVVVLAIMRGPGPQYVPLLALVGIGLGLAVWLFGPPDPPRREGPRPPILDLSLFRGPVGLLALAGALRAVAYVSFLNAMPLYLVTVVGLAADAPLVATTLAVYGIASAASGLVSGSLEARVGRTRLIVGTMLLAVPVLLATLAAPVGTPAYFVLVALAGMTTNASVPLLIVSAQDLAPQAVGTASGMLMGLTWGSAGVAYLGFGALQQAIGLTPAIAMAFAMLVPAALLAGVVLARVSR